MVKKRNPLQFFLSAALFLSILLLHSQFATGPTAFAQTTTPKMTPFDLANPEGLCISGKSQIQLTWSVSNAANTYVVMRRSPSQPTWTFISNRLPNKTTFIDVSPPAGEISYRITAVKGHERMVSNIQIVTAHSCASLESSAAPFALPAQSIGKWGRSSSSNRLSSIKSSARSTSSAKSTSTGIVSSALTGQSARSISSGAKSSVKSSAKSSTSPISIPAGSKAWGAATGYSVQDGLDFEKTMGKKMSHRAVFIHWGNENAFPLDVAKAMNGRPLIIFWEAMDYNVSGADQSKFSYKAILKGDWDTYFTSFAKSAKDYGGPVILIPFEEMNGNWYPSSITKNGNTGADHIAAYRYIHNFFTNATNVKFAWSVNNDSVPNTADNQIEKFYPGDDYVDIVGVDGFNFGSPWQTFDQVFAASLKKLKVYKKPIYIFSTATAPGPLKAAWITDAFTVQMAKYPEIVGWVWFNENKERDWRMWSDDASLKAFQALLP